MWLLLGIPIKKPNKKLFYTQFGPSVFDSKVKLIICKNLIVALFFPKKVYRFKSSTDIFVFGIFLWKHIGPNHNK